MLRRSLTHSREDKRRRRWIYLCLFLGLLSIAKGVAPAQDRSSDPTSMSLEELMKIQVYSASRHLQEAEEAPSSVTVVTAEEIQRYGYRTLADVLRNVRGFYVTYDRNYSYVGVRGFAPLGDLNARILVMVDGHRLNDNIYDQALIGTDLPLDLDAVERIEIVRGPSSSLYGSNAFFGVINLITKSRSAVKHGQISSEIGSLGTYKGHFLLGETLPHGIEALLAGSVSESQGNYRLFFPEFNSPANNNGYAVNADNDAAKNFLAKLVFHNFTLESVVGTREKGIPTASWDTAFNDARNKTIDSEGNLMLTYNRDLGETTNLFTRVSYNRYVYTGYYADLPAPAVLNRDMARGDWWGLEAKSGKGSCGGTTLAWEANSGIISGKTWTPTTSPLTPRWSMSIRVPTSGPPTRRMSSPSPPSSSSMRVSAMTITTSLAAAPTPVSAFCFAPTSTLP